MRHTAIHVSTYLDQLSQVSHHTLVSECVPWDPSCWPQDHSTARRSAILYGRGPLKRISWDACFLLQLENSSKEDDEASC